MTDLTHPEFTWSQSTMEAPEQWVESVNWRHSGVFIVNFEHILHMLSCFDCRLLNKWIPSAKII